MDGRLTEWEVLPGLPAYGPEAEPFSATGQGKHREGFVIRFIPSSSGAWIGNFQRGFGRCEGVWRHPNGAHVFVVAGGTAYLIDPQDHRLVHHFGADLSDVIDVPDIQAIVFTNGLWFEAITATGLLWRSRRVSWDGLQRLQLDETTLCGDAYDPTDDTWQPFRLDLLTGNVTGGSYTGPSM